MQQLRWRHLMPETAKDLQDQVVRKLFKLALKTHVYPVTAQWDFNTLPPKLLLVVAYRGQQVGIDFMQTVPARAEVNMLEESVALIGQAIVGDIIHAIASLLVERKIWSRVELVTLRVEKTYHFTMNYLKDAQTWGSKNDEN